jgi:hypothetical protein
VEVNNDMDSFIYRIGSSDNILGRPPRFYSSTDLAGSGCRFASVYAVRKEDAEAIETTSGTAAGFKGIVWSQKLWVDFDTYEAASEAEKTLDKLGLGYVVYDTGGRGKHIGINRDTKPSHTLPGQDKAWVQANLVGADLSLYWHLHLIRLPGAVHEKTGGIKKLIKRKEGNSVQLGQPKENEAVSVSEVTTSPGARNSIFGTWSVMSNITPTGHRRQLVELAVALQRDVGVTTEEATWVLLEVNRGFNVPRDVDEIERIVAWAYETK